MINITNRAMSGKMLLLLLLYQCTPLTTSSFLSLSDKLPSILGTELRFLQTILRRRLPRKIRQHKHRRPEHQPAKISYSTDYHTVSQITVDPFYMIDPPDLAAQASNNITNVNHTNKPKDVGEIKVGDDDHKKKEDVSNVVKTLHDKRTTRKPDSHHPTYGAYQAHNIAAHSPTTSVPAITFIRGAFVETSASQHYDNNVIRIPSPTKKYGDFDLYLPSPNPSWPPLYYNSLVRPEYSKKKM